MLKAYKYRMYPNHTQQELIAKHIGACRFIYNWALENKIKLYEQDGKAISRFELNKQIRVLKDDHYRELLLILKTLPPSFSEYNQFFQNLNPSRTLYNF
jgi:putative transposase